MNPFSLLAILQLLQPMLSCLIVWVVDSRENVSVHHIYNNNNNTQQKPETSWTETGRDSRAGIIIKFRLEKSSLFLTFTFFGLDSSFFAGWCWPLIVREWLTVPRYHRPHKHPHPRICVLAMVWLLLCGHCTYQTAPREEVPSGRWIP